MCPQNRSTMKNILLVPLMLFAVHCSGQEWVDYKPDSVLTISIPEDYQLIDTMGQRIARAYIDNGLIIVLKMANQGEAMTTVESEDGLVQFYKNFRQGFIRSHHGELLDDEIIDKNGLKLIRFSYRASVSNERQIRHCVTLLVNETIYALNFWEVESKAGELRNTKEKFYSSMRTRAGLTIEDQMSHHGQGSQAYLAGDLFGKILFFGLVFGVIIFLIIRFSKKKRTSA